jgi:hypothetical protein
MHVNHIFPLRLGAIYTYLLVILQITLITRSGQSKVKTTAKGNVSEDGLYFDEQLSKERINLSYILY